MNTNGKVEAVLLSPKRTSQVSSLAVVQLQQLDALVSSRLNQLVAPASFSARGADWSGNILTS